MQYKIITDELAALANKDYANHYMKFFQTHKGGYGEGDTFWGIRAPNLRAVAKKYTKTATLEDMGCLMEHKIHEARVTGLLLMNAHMKRDAEAVKSLYLDKIDRINNWDLVDISAPNILGIYCYDRKDISLLWELARSGKLWRERISIIATLWHTRKGSLNEALLFAEYFLRHKHDLMHKAAGWVLREAGKKDETALLVFLDKHYKNMPRTMLRYSLERLNEQKRKHYMAK